MSKYLLIWYEGVVEQTHGMSLNSLMHCSLYMHIHVYKCVNAPTLTKGSMYVSRYSFRPSAQSPGAS